MNLFTDDNPETTLHGLGFKNPEITEQSLIRIEEYFDRRCQQQLKHLPSYPINLRPRQRLINPEQTRRYYQNQKMTRVLSLLNRAQSVIKQTKDPKKRQNILTSLKILEKWINDNKLGGSSSDISEIVDCCHHTANDKECQRRSDSHVFSLPRKFSLTQCQDIRGFSMRSSCAPYKDCRINNIKPKIGGGNGSKDDNNDPILTPEEFNKISEQAKHLGVYAPKKYFKGLTYPEAKDRLLRMKKGVKSDSSDPEAYRPFKTDYRKGVKIQTKLSKYTQQWQKYFPGVTSIEEKSELTGVPLTILKTIFDKGCAAWRTGHRPGAGAAQWGHARVNSFLVKGKTFYTADKYLATEIMESKQAKFKKAQDWFQSVDGICDTRKDYTLPAFCQTKDVVNLYRSK